MKQRRILLKGIGLSVPAIWATPVVQSVVLPAHAQTSAAESSSAASSSDSDGCSALVITGRTRSCPTTENVSSTVTIDYRIDDSAACPVLTQSQRVPRPIISDSDDILRVRASTNGFTDLVSIRVQTSGGEVSRELACTATDPGSSATGPLMFDSSSGATYQAEFTISATIDGGSNSLTLSDITLTPI